MCDGIVHPIQLLAVTSSRTTERTSAGAGLTALMVRSWVRSLLLSRLTPVSVNEWKVGCVPPLRGTTRIMSSPKELEFARLWNTSRTTAQGWIFACTAHPNLDRNSPKSSNPTHVPELLDEGHVNVKSGAAAVSRPLANTPAHEAIEQLQSNLSREFPKIASTATNHTHRKFDDGMERCPGAQSTAMAPKELDEVSEPRVPPELRGDSTPFNHNGLPEAGTASE
ncbi:hypothetical protein EDB83DRAFT_2314670 [Lactarius deliciosus]|nr:hypothetical protein EDB83DRAFT_2318768 [Lactarius deliciosus]KAH9068140.1 hypothetical protein EDB83DRAFT_2314670 [Lactarius deliciosus]